MNYFPNQAMSSYFQLAPPNQSPGLVGAGSSFASPNNRGLTVAISNDSSPSDADASPKAQNGSPLDGQQPDRVGPPSGKIVSPSVLVQSPDDELTLPAKEHKFYKGQMGLAVAISNDSSSSDADALYKGQDGSPLDGQQPDKVGPPSGKVGSPSVLVRSPDNESTLPAKGPEFYTGQIFPREEAFDAAVEARVAHTNKKVGRERSSAKRVHGPDYESFFYSCKRCRFNKKARPNKHREKTTSYMWLLAVLTTLSSIG